MAKANRLTLILFFIFTTLACNKQAVFTVEPIDPELNTRLITPGELNKDLFSTKELFQYYQLSNYDGLPTNELLSELDKFISKQYKLSKTKNVSEIDFLFYKKSVFTNLSKQVYEAARDNENGSLTGYADDLVARITYSKFRGNKAVRAAHIYKNGRRLLDRSEAISLK